MKASRGDDYILELFDVIRKKEFGEIQDFFMRFLLTEQPKTPPAEGVF
jgi:hypothetical protein